ncbi:hypothetical protein Q1695_007403 [Nippostrongylus brasiliensis]|nr:hypothetical protein Q1695_007403 [Nippostrongylus brasiliensis]
MSGIGVHIERFESTTVPVNIQSVYGKEMNFTVQTKPVITGSFPSVKLPQLDADFLEKHRICVANSKLQGERQLPQILVGLDRYYDLIMDDGLSKKTPSGLRIANTVFGPAIYGRGMLDGPIEPQSVSFGLTAIHETPENRVLENTIELEEVWTPTDDSQAKGKVQEYSEDYVNSMSSDSGCVTAPLPLKNMERELENNNACAIKRLASLQNPQEQNPQSLWYGKGLNDDKDQRIIECVFDKTEDSARTYFMPQPGAWRTHKSEPLRITSDAPSKGKGQMPLNENVHRNVIYFYRATPMTGRALSKLACLSFPLLVNENMQVVQAILLQMVHTTTTAAVWDALVAEDSTTPYCDIRSCG